MGEPVSVGLQIGGKVKRSVIRKLRTIMAEHYWIENDPDHTENEAEWPGMVWEEANYGDVEWFEQACADLGIDNYEINTDATYDCAASADIMIDGERISFPTCDGVPMVSAREIISAREATACWVQLLEKCHRMVKTLPNLEVLDDETENTTT